MTNQLPSPWPSPKGRGDCIEPASIRSGHSIQKWLFQSVRLLPYLALVQIAIASHATTITLIN